MDEQHEDLNVIDLFSGAGGFTEGFKKAGYNVILAIDDNSEGKDSTTTYKYNHPEINVIDKDIKNVTIDEIKNEIGSKKIHVIIGGPPCQGMSLAGKRLSDDPRNQLFREYVRIVEGLKPDYFVFENVKGMKTAEKGKIFKAIQLHFKDIGYDISWSELMAINYGVPQTRPRIFIIGSKIGPAPSFPQPTHSSIDFKNSNENQVQTTLDGSSHLKPYITVEEAIGDLPKVESGGGKEEMDYSSEPLHEYQETIRKGSSKVYNHVPPKHTKKLIEMIEKTLPGKPVDPKYNESKKWDPKKPSDTVKALGRGGGSTNRRYFHYKYSRGSTVRENARIQSFPDKYRFLGSKTNQMTQVGNAVPPKVAEAIANSLKPHLISAKGNNNEHKRKTMAICH